MLHTFVPFVAVTCLSFCYAPIITAIALSSYLALGLSILGYKTYIACFYSLCEEPVDYSNFTPLLKGKTVLITGANKGVGYGVAQEMASHGANIIIAVRSEMDQTIKSLKNIATKNGHSNSDIRGFHIDLADFSSYLSFFKQLEESKLKVDILVLNAGMTIHPPQVTQDGIDMMLFVNFLSNVILIRYFIKLQLFNESNGKTKTRKIPRIVTTSSDTHRWSKYRDFQTVYEYNVLEQVNHYAMTKLYNQMLINHCSARYRNKIDCYGHCPGPVYSSIARHSPLLLRLFAYCFMGVLFQGIERGGRHIVYSCMKPREHHKSGTYRWMMHQPELSEDSVNRFYIDELMRHANAVVDELEQKYAEGAARS